MNKIISEIKQQEQDFEFYPTTKEIINSIRLENNLSILDIGAGNGNSFKLFEENGVKFKSKYAIEKSEILINLLQEDVFIMGTDFNEQTLIDKNVDVIFCNPPYSEFAQWTLKILKEGNCKTFYAVIPERWKENKEIEKIIEKRGIEKNIIGSFSFENSEYRKARANVEVIKFTMPSNLYRDKTAFDIWFEENFKIEADKNDRIYLNSEKKQAEKDAIKNELTTGKNLVEALEELYTKEFNNLLNNYKSLEQLDYSLLKELNVNIENLKQSLKKKIEGLKNKYWQELFDNLDKLTDRLTSDSRRKMLNTLNQNTNIDFTASNAYSIIIWALKNANSYIDTQLQEVYFDMASPENIKNYKSNTHFEKDRWMYAKNKDRETAKNFKLDYRLVFSGFRCFNQSSYGGYDYPNGLYKDRHDFLNNICVVGKNLGFNVITTTKDFQWEPRTKHIFKYNKNGKEFEFMEVKAYFNGNLHCKLNQDFLIKLNIEMARLSGWLRNPADISEELDYPIDKVMSMFNTNQKLLKSDLLLL